MPNEFVTCLQLEHEGKWDTERCCHYCHTGERASPNGEPGELLEVTLSDEREATLCCNCYLRVEVEDD